MTEVIPKNLIQQILDSVDITAVIQRYIPLKNKGNNYIACCPFHKEKTPSFSVNLQKKFYYCFGCGAHGNAINFLMQWRGDTFVDAVKSLADEAGVFINAEKNSKIKKDNIIYSILEDVADYYAVKLREHEHQLVVDYLKARGVTGVIAKKFKLGFAPGNWSSLTKDLSFTAQELVKAGVVVKTEQHCYDRFRNRLMFPIRNPYGQIIGFGGRQLDINNEPKYLNSPESSVFNKSRCVYGLYESMADIRKQKRVIIVEGYMDVISLHQHGINEVVATLGTACTRHHIDILLKYTKELIFCFDGDAAGHKATLRVVDNLLPLINDTDKFKILSLPAGEDPDSLVKKQGKDVFLHLLSSADNLTDYLIKLISQRMDATNVEGRVQLAVEAQAWLNKIPEGFTHQLLSKHLTEVLGVNFLGNNKPEINTKAWRKPINKNIALQNIAVAKPTQRAVGLILHQPGLVQDLPDVSYLVGLKIPGIELLLEVVAVLKVHNNLPIENLSTRLSPTALHYWHPQALMSMVSFIPSDARKSELDSIFLSLKRQFKSIKLQNLLINTPVHVMDVSQKMELEKLWQEVVVHEKN